MNRRNPYSALLRWGFLLGFGLCAQSSSADPAAEDLARLRTLAGEYLPTTGLTQLALQEWFPGVAGCRFRLAEPPSSFSQFFVSTKAEGLTEMECPAYRLIGMFKEGSVIGPAVQLDRAQRIVYGGLSWPQGVLNGPGVGVHANGDRYEGTFVGGGLIGAAVVTRPDGSTTKGYRDKGRFMPGEIVHYDPKGQLLGKDTIDLNGNVALTRVYRGDELSLEAPVVDGLKHGFGSVYEADAQGTVQRRATLWEKDVIRYQSANLSDILSSPCPPLLTALGGFRPLADSCSAAALPPPPVVEVVIAPASEPAPAIPAEGKSGLTALDALPVIVASPDTAAEPGAVIELAPLPLPEPIEVREHPFLAYSEDGKNYLRGLTRNGVLVPDEIGFDGGIRRYKSKAMDEKLNGAAQYFQGSELVFDGNIVEGQFDGTGLCRFNGSLERCEYAYGERVDQLFKTRLELQAYKSAKQQEQEQIAREHQAKLALERQRIAQAQAAQRAAAQQQDSGFQWGKLAALGVGAVAGGITKLPSSMQADIITGFVSDSMAGQQGITNTQQALSASGGGAASAAASSAPAKAPMQSTTYRANCPGTGSEINIPISYRTQACLSAAQAFALAYACNDADSFASVTQGCVAACGSSQCAEQ